MGKTIAVIGLGLIGGSLATALRGFQDYEIIGVDQNEETLRIAKARGAADIITGDAKQAVLAADVTFLCMHPAGILSFFRDYAGCFRPGSLVTDVCGIKTAVAEGAKALPEGVFYIGGHPMAGKETSGIQNADGALFRGAHYILTPSPDSRADHIRLLTDIARHIGCKDVMQTTPQEHDRLIAYTSQIMHVMAVAVCDDPGLFRCKGFEGNSFRDCTRVAALDIPLWTELFSMNAPALCEMIERLEDNLRSYRHAIASGDTKTLAEKLSYSSARKRKMNLD